MNKYHDKSDSEINELVSFSLGYIHTKSFDPCNNPVQAMPIIIENKITVAYDKLYETWCAHVGSVVGDGDWDYSIEPAINYCDDNYYRAAMICFLMMKDAENES